MKNTLPKKTTAKKAAVKKVKETVVPKTLVSIVSDIHNDLGILTEYQSDPSKMGEVIDTLNKYINKGIWFLPTYGVSERSFNIVLKYKNDFWDASLILKGKKPIQVIKKIVPVK